MRNAVRPLMSEGTSDQILQTLSPEDFRRLDDYLRSAAFQSLAMQVVLADLYPQSAKHTELSADVREALRHGLRHRGIATEALTELTDVVMASLTASAQTAWQEVAGGRRSTSSATLLSALGQITAMAARNKGLLAGVGSIAAFHRLAAKMRAQIAAFHDRVRLPHIGVSRSVEWEQLYVTPTLRTQFDAERPMDIAELVGTGNRYVVLGDPGAGKSTLAAKLVHDISTSGTGEIVPFLMTLRNHSARFESGGRPLVEHLVAACADPYNVAMTAEAAEYFLLNGQAAVVLDGLDELTELSLRSRVIHLIEGFATAYPLVPIVVTSRRIGYTQATAMSDALPGGRAPVEPSATALDERLFSKLFIESFSPAQVTAYSRNWFALDEGHLPAERTRLCEAFLRESESIADLRRNPLLLALLCAMYGASQFIPRNRAQVYERCALMVFERWDSIRGIRLPLEFHGHVRGAIQLLAWRMFENGGRTELPARTVLKILVNFLRDRGYDEYEASRVGDSFLAFCAGRAWVLREVGTTDAEPMYGFAHRTFLEFFAAEYVVRHYELPEHVWKVIGPNLSLGKWDIVGQLALQLLERNIDYGADRLLVYAIDEVRSPRFASNATNLTVFLARSLGHVAPSSMIVTDIVDICVDAVLSLGTAERCSFSLSPHKSSLVQRTDGPLHALLTDCLEGNLPLVDQALSKRLRRDYPRHQLTLAAVLRAIEWPGLCEDTARSGFWHDWAQSMHIELITAYPPVPTVAGAEALAPAQAVVLSAAADADDLRLLYSILWALRPIGEPPALAGLGSRSIDGGDWRLANAIRELLSATSLPWLSTRSVDAPAMSAYFKDWADTALPEGRHTHGGTELATLLVLCLPYLEIIADGGESAPPGPPVFRLLVDARRRSRAGTLLLDSREVRAVREHLREAQVPESDAQLLRDWIVRAVSTIGHSGRTYKG
ncbi:NACHT domain-containing protein [Dactylosporangium salmoneum]|uniref:NACHT domain-containing protein n=1 Tax=Dactylosporangium salmoneum TaxID=53361 RepID=A0ABP5T029_9ACTN